jgi:hypothetical protein
VFRDHYIEVPVDRYVEIEVPYDRIVEVPVEKIVEVRDEREIRRLEDEVQKKKDCHKKLCTKYKDLEKEFNISVR